MIREVTMYQAVCDGCGRGFGLELTDGMARYMAKMRDWQEINGKLYCPDCVEYDEETDSYKPKGKK